MMNESKSLPGGSSDTITVYSFNGSVIIPTEQGSYWANAVGGVVESRPVGNPFILFSLRYIWGLSGEVSEFPEPVRIRLNTMMAVTEKPDFRFPAPEATEEVIVKESLGKGEYNGDNEDSKGDEDEEDEEDEGLEGELDDGLDDKAEDDDELDRILAESFNSDDDEDSLSW